MVLTSLCSIEDAKQKAEHDKMMKIADEKKKDVRRQIAKLRRQFKSILEQNEGLPVHLQLRKEVQKIICLWIETMHYQSYRLGFCWY